VGGEDKIKILVVSFDRIILTQPKLRIYIFGSGRGLNPGPCIFYALSQPTELSSRGPKLRI